VIEPSAKEAIKFFKLGCAHGHALSCGNIAGIYLNGDMGVEQDVKQGRDYATRACKGGITKWCHYAR
jgi:TPR repeat protein